MATRHIVSIAAAAALAAGLACGANAIATPTTGSELAAASWAQAGEPEPGRARAGMRARGGARIAAMRDPALAAIVNLRAIERVYRHEQREAELPDYLRSVLARTQDATVRNYVNFRLARIEMREKDAKGALEALERGLEENLRRLQ